MNYGLFSNIILFLNWSIKIIFSSVYLVCKHHRHRWSNPLDMCKSWSLQGPCQERRNERFLNMAWWPGKDRCISPGCILTCLNNRCRLCIQALRFSLRHAAHNRRMDFPTECFRGNGRTQHDPGRSKQHSARRVNSRRMDLCNGRCYKPDCGDNRDRCYIRLSRNESADYRNNLDRNGKPIDDSCHSILHWWRICCPRYKGSHIDRCNK